MYSFNFLLDEFDLDQIKFSYTGEINSDLTESLLDLLMHFFSVQKVPRKNQNKLLRICVEVIQNVTKHQERSQGGIAAIYITSDNNTISLTACNVVKYEDKERITEKINQINEFEDFKEQYREALKESTLDQKGGAGIGLIDIAYRSGSLPKVLFKALPNSNLYLYKITTPLFAVQVCSII